MELLHRLNEIVEDEIKNLIKKGEVSPGEWENLERAVCIMYKTKKVEKMLMEIGEYGHDYSTKSYHIPNVTNHHMNSMSPRHYEIESYERGRSPRTGRYVSRDGGYSSHSIKDRVIDQIERMYDEAGTDHERHVLEDMIRIIDDTKR